MELSKLTSEQLITLNSDLSSKDEIIKFLVSKLYQAGKISNEEDFYQAVLERESLTPTGIDNGLAIPHGKDGVVREAAFAVVTLKKPVKDWEMLLKVTKYNMFFYLQFPKMIGIRFKCNYWQK